ncbi:MAG TPA: AAA family ATPase, partial [Candidatus Limnocylindria bacterium]
MELLERQELLDDLVARLRDAAPAGGHVVVVEGESGIGKTSVLRALAARAPATGLRVLWGACDALATPRPLGPVHDMAARGATAARDGLLAGGRAHEVFEGLLADLATPSLAIIEDLHWADEATLDLVRFVGRRMATTPSVLVVTLRDDEVGLGHPVRAVLGDLATSGWLRVRLEPLTEAAVRQLAAGHDVDPDELHRVTGGNPFYVTEVLAQPGATVPRSVRDAVLARVGRLPERSRAIVELVSVEPGSFGRRLLRQLGQDDRAVDEALRAAVLVDDGAGLRIRHELARRAVEDGLGAERAADLHRRLLEALAADPDTDPARLAHHAAAIDDPAAGLRWSTAAAERAARSSANREAAAHYERAVRHVDRLAPAEGAALLASYAEVLSLVDQATRAVEVLEEAVARYEAAGDRVAAWTTRAQLARAVWTAGRSVEGYALIDRVVHALEAEEDDPRVAEAFAIGGYLAMLDRRTEDAATWSRRAIGLAERHEQRGALSLALNALGAARIVGREDLEGVDDLRRSGAEAEALGNRRGVAGMYSNLGSGLGEIRRYDLAVPALEDAVEYGAAHELELTRHYAMAWLARIRFEQGRWDEADALATAAIGGAEASPISPMVALCARGRTRARRGTPAADDPLSDAWRIAEASGDLQRTWPAIAGVAEAAWLTGRPTTGILDDLAPVLALARDRG